MTVVLSIAWTSWILGLHALAPWACARPGADRRIQIWRQGALPALLSAALLAALSLADRIDAALAWGLTWPPARLPASVLLIAAAAVLLLDLVVLAGGPRFEPAAWWVAGSLGLLLLGAACVAGELLRVGRGPAGALGALALGAGARAALALAAAEATLGRPRWLAPLAGLALPAAAACYPPALRAALTPHLPTLLAASLLLLAARFLPATLRRPTVFAALLLAALYLATAGARSEMLEPPLRLPDSFLPEPG